MGDPLSVANCTISRADPIFSFGSSKPDGTPRKMLDILKATKTQNRISGRGTQTYHWYLRQGVIE